MGEGARRLAGAQRRVDPGVLEKTPADLGQGLGESGVGVEHGAARLVPGDQAVLVLGQRRVAVPIGQRLDPEPLGLEPVVAVREARIGGAHGRDQGPDHLVLDEVLEIARGHRALELAPAVLDLLVLGQRVGDQREDAQVLAQHPAEGFRRRLAYRAVAVGHLVEDLGAGQRCPVEREAQRRHGLVEQAHPGGAPGDALLVQQALQVVAEFVFAERAHVAQPGAVARQRGHRHLVLQLRVAQAVELEGEEQDLGRDIGRALLHGLIEAADRGVAHVAGVDQLGVARNPPEGLLDRLVDGDRRAQGRAVEPGEPALVTGAKVLGLGLAALEVAVQPRRVRTGIEVPQIPARQRAQVLATSNPRFRVVRHGTALLDPPRYRRT